METAGRHRIRELDGLIRHRLLLIQCLICYGSVALIGRWYVCMLHRESIVQQREHSTQRQCSTGCTERDHKELLDTLLYVTSAGDLHARNPKTPFTRYNRVGLTTGCIM